MMTRTWHKQYLTGPKLFAKLGWVYTPELKKATIVYRLAGTNYYLMKITLKNEFSTGLIDFGQEYPFELKWFNTSVEDDITLVAANQAIDEYQYEINANMKG